MCSVRIGKYFFDFFMCGWSKCFRITFCLEKLKKSRKTTSLIWVGKTNSINRMARWFSIFCCSPHAVTGFIGLTLLTIQTILPTLFEVNPLNLSKFITLISSRKQNFLSFVYLIRDWDIVDWSILMLRYLQGNPGLRNVHGILGSGIMTLFLVHAFLGLQLGLSY